MVDSITPFSSIDVGGDTSSEIMGKYRCDECNLPFTRYYDMQRHKSRKHGNDDELSSSDSVSQVTANSNTSSISTSDTGTDATSLVSSSLMAKDDILGAITEDTEIWDELKSEVMSTYGPKINEDISTMMSQGMSERKAGYLAASKWLPSVHKGIYNAYFDNVCFFRDLTKDRLHHKIMNLKRKIEQTEDNEDWEEDLRQAIKRKKYAIQKATRTREEDIPKLNYHEDSEEEEDEIETESETGTTI